MYYKKTISKNWLSTGWCSGNNWPFILFANICKSCYLVPVRNIIYQYQLKYFNVNVETLFWFDLYYKITKNWITYTVILRYYANFNSTDLIRLKHAWLNSKFASTAADLLSISTFCRRVKSNYKSIYIKNMFEATSFIIPLW